MMSKCRLSSASVWGADPKKEPYMAGKKGKKKDKKDKKAKG